MFFLAGGGTSEMAKDFSLVYTYTYDFYEVYYKVKTVHCLVLTRIKARFYIVLVSLCARTFLYTPVSKIKYQQYR